MTDRRRAGGVKRYPSIGVCGLDCGLCPRYYTVGKSRCPGCGGPGFSEKHPSCSFITCCVKKRGLEVCGECEEFPCSKFKSEEEYLQIEGASSYPPYRTVMANLRFIQGHGTKQFVKRQAKRIGLLETMIEGYDDGRSRSYYCRAAALLDPAAIERSLEEAKRRIRAGEVNSRDARGKAGMLKSILTKEGV